MRRPGILHLYHVNPVNSKPRAGQDRYSPVLINQEDPLLIGEALLKTRPSGIPLSGGSIAPNHTANILGPGQLLFWAPFMRRTAQPVHVESDRGMAEFPKSAVIRCDTFSATDTNFRALCLESGPTSDVASPNTRSVMLCPNTRSVMLTHRRSGG